MIMMDSSSREAGFSVAVVALILAIYNQVLPPQREVAAHPSDGATVGTTRMHMANAAALSAVVGLGAGWMVKSWWPPLAAVITVGWLTAAYEMAARRCPS